MQMELQAFYEEKGQSGNRLSRAPGHQPVRPAPDPDQLLRVPGFAEKRAPSRLRLMKP